MADTKEISAGKRLKGQCLCGSVRFTAVPTSHEMSACHCAMCRRWTAGPYLAVSCGASIEFETDEGLTFYPSSAWGERGFCNTCGSSLLWKMQGHRECYVSAQAFDDAGVFNLAAEIFIDEKPHGYDFAGNAKKMTGAEVIAAVTKEQEGA